MTADELKTALALAALFVLRMLGVFLILPVFALYAEELQGTTPLLVGLAIGIYGLTQATLQIPFGLLSDRFGRKRIIVIGLLLFAGGSILAALAESIYWVIAGRALQGTGAIAAAVLALAADLTREEHRTKVMAIIGLSIGLSFALSMILGPLLDGWVGVDGIFWITAGFALSGIVLVRFVVPDPIQSRLHRDTTPVPQLFRQVLRDPQLLRLDLGVLILHMVLTATFVALPLALRDQAGLETAEHWQLYLPVLLLSILAMAPFIMIAERRRRMKTLFLSAILVLSLSESGLLFWHQNTLVIGLSLFLFFTSFNFLEASLPSLVAKMSPPDAKGTAMGVYSSSQFSGAFIGGVMGGGLLGLFGLSVVFAFAATALLLWFLVAYTMKNPRYLSSYLLKVGMIGEQDEQQLAVRLTQIKGVAEAVVIAADGIAYLKVDRHALDESALQQFSAAETHSVSV